MPRDTTIECPEGVWTELTNADVTEATFQVLSGSGVQIKATEGAVAPLTTQGSTRYQIGQGELAVQIVELAPGIAATRIFAIATEGTARVSVSHA